MNALLELKDKGQSYWLDNLTRGMMTNGELQKRIDEEGLRGITSNPKIFDKAITQSDDYDDQISTLVKEGKEVGEIYEALVIRDIQNACDMLRPVYDESDGVDGFVSLEVSPYLARHTEPTIKETRRLFSEVDRPNCFIKIPGTEQGFPAIEQMLYEGINVNITLLFSIESYEAVAEAYLRALERRIVEDKPVDKIRSVASFFLSRIDVLVDQLLQHRILPEGDSGISREARQLLGKIAIANGKMAYRSFKRIFSGDRWRALAEKGAKVQRPLWASTSTKNPDYSDVRYVEPLIGEHTVNTMPGKTIAAFKDHGKAEKNTVEKELEEARRSLRNLEKVGIDLDKVTWQLVNEGIQKFIDPYDELMKNLKSKREKLS